MTSRKTDGQRLARLAIDNWPDEIWIAERIDRLIRKRKAEAWDEGNVSPGYLKDNPYRGSRRK
jgi:hypothetical protein